MVFPGVQGGPHMNAVCAKAVAFGEALKPEFQQYAQQVLNNAQELAKQLMAKGFKLITNGTDNHLMLCDVMASFGVSGKVAEETFDKIHLTLNKNMIPDDPRKPFDPSGIRLGTPALTSRGMKEEHMDIIADVMHKAITHYSDEVYLEKLSNEVMDFCKKFPLPSDL
jgi:glycine hydroxymethyltransferase